MKILPSGPPPKGTRWRLYTHHLGDYMHRWILLTPWGSLRLHHILRSDDDRHLHDHPFDFTSFLLTGRYTEITEQINDHLGSWSYGQYWPRFSLVRKVAEEKHRLELERPIWTFVITGPKRRDWGFHTELGWVYYRDYPTKFPEVIRSRLGDAGAVQYSAEDAQLRSEGR